MLKNTEFTSRVNAQDMATFQRVCPDKHYKKGSTIFFTGDAATELHVIASGQVKLVVPTANGSERILAVCGPNDFFGEAFLHDSARYKVDAIAIDDTRTCPISRDQYKHLAQEAPNFAMTFTEMLAGHLFQCRDQLTASYDPVKVRLAKVLIEQAESFGQSVGNGAVELTTNLKHADLASMITATRVSVSMTLAELRIEGLVRGTRGKYMLSLDGLKNLTL